MFWSKSLAGLLLKVSPFSSVNSFVKKTPESAEDAEWFSGDGGITDPKNYSSSGACLRFDFPVFVFSITQEPRR